MIPYAQERKNKSKLHDYLGISGLPCNGYQASTKNMYQLPTRSESSGKFELSS